QEAATQGIEVDVAKSKLSSAPAITMYEAAFRKYGIDRESIASEEAVLRIRNRPPQIQLVIFEALYRWWVSEWDAKKSSEDRRRQAWLVEVIKESDPDPWRTRMRQAAYEREYKTLEELARAEAVTQQGPLTLRTLALMLDQRGQRDLGIALLRRAQHSYPGHF